MVYKLRLMGEQPRLINPPYVAEKNDRHRPPLHMDNWAQKEGKLTKLLSVQQAGCLMHVAPVPVLMAMIGLQPSPRRPSIVGRGIQSSPVK